MSRDELDQLAALVKRERQALLTRWRQQVRQLPSARELDIPTLNDHMPGLLDELAMALHRKAEKSIPEALLEDSPPAHGFQRLENEFDIEEVVAEYNILRGCIHDLADENGLRLQGRPFHVLNRIFDHAIGLALQTYATQHALEVQRRREEYLAFIAHDLRTPLNAISVAGRVLELRLPTGVASAETVHILKALRRNVQQLEALVGKVLEENTSIQTDAGIKLVRREFDLWPLVEALVFDFHTVAATAGTQLVNKVPGDLVVYADAGLLGRIFQNLIANAIKFTPRGEVVIGAREPDADGIVECWVRDNGAGIPAALRDRVFDKGESDLENGGGSGLGLAIVKSFTESHGGKVSVESNEGAGSTFRFTLPAKDKGGPA